MNVRAIKISLKMKNKRLVEYKNNYIMETNKCIIQIFWSEYTSDFFVYGFIFQTFSSIKKVITIKHFLNIFLLVASGLSIK